MTDVEKLRAMIKFKRKHASSFDRGALTVVGAAEEHARLKPLLDLLPSLVEALERECVCDAKRRSGPGYEDVPCEPCEALAKVRDVVKGVRSERSRV